MGRFLKFTGVIVAIVLLGIAIWETQVDKPEKWVAFERFPEGIMGTSCHLSVVMDYRSQESAKKILDKAEYRIRYIESLASNWIEESEVSQFNRADGGVTFEFSRTNWEVIHFGAELYKATAGAFDLTCRPLIELWKKAGQSGVMPRESEIDVAKTQSSWALLEFNEGHYITKTSADLRIDLGGIAKGYAIDQAVQAMIELGAIGGLVDIGGDLRVFGKSSRASGEWLIEVKDPFRKGLLRSATYVGDVAVCTSGNYARYVQIEGKRYSHIINPKTGYPTEKVPSVTVVADSAMEADVWATALSVLGPDGFRYLPEGVEALLLYGNNEKSEAFETPGFSSRRLLR